MTRLFQPVDIACNVYFRIVFGLMMLLQFSHFPAAEERREGIRKPQVFAFVRVALNGREPQPLVDPTVDLAAQPRTLAPKAWVLPVN